MPDLNLAQLLIGPEMLTLIWHDSRYVMTLGPFITKNHFDTSDREIRTYISLMEGK